MLHLKNIVKNYEAGNTTVEALRSVDLQFRDNEFVSILGPSGCGKTTMLNILGGLDRYTSGDLVINGKSTKDFSDRDWDVYRNRRIGFVFQNYNLIPHQTVLRNVELALTLSGVSKSERRKRAVEVLGKVGLADQIHKRPGQMSGGQMQRVSIARALINNPDILLADEPTGALDSETSVQIMELIKEIARERLVIMVTHNSELAESYSTRIIKLFDGSVVGDSNPLEGTQPVVPAEKKKRGKTSMSFITAISLSFNNLLTKKARTLLTAFAGSIGIIGIALILSLSHGSQEYINRVQEDALSTYPIAIQETTSNITSMMTSMMKMGRGIRDREPDRVYSNDIMSGMLQSMLAGVETNDLASFKRHIDENSEYLGEYTNAITYGYNVNLNIYSSDYTNGIKLINPSDLFSAMGSQQYMMGMDMGTGLEVWTEMIDSPALLTAQYDILEGRWPEKMSEVVLFVDGSNGISDVAMYTLGLKDEAEVDAMIKSMATGADFESEAVSYSYDELIGLSYKLILSPDLYQKNGGVWLDMSGDEAYMRNLIDGALDIVIVGIARPAENADMTSVSGAIGYTAALTGHIIEEVNSSELVKEQFANPEIDVFTGKPFAGADAEPQQIDISLLPPEMQAFLATLSEEEARELLAGYSATSDVTFEDNIKLLGVVSEDSPSTITIYPKDFASKEIIEQFIADYNAGAGEDAEISYTDFVGLMMSSVSSIINMISYLLIGFVGISLVVSSIMIGIITYVSVLERTKEIGILKSIGASRKDISRVFNAETLIVGFVSGSLGILITAILIIPANMIIKALSGVGGIAVLPLAGAVILVLLSMGLTLIAGLIPSKIAAKKDPVVALRTE